MGSGQWAHCRWWSKAVRDCFYNYALALGRLGGVKMGCREIGLCGIGGGEVHRTLSLASFVRLCGIRVIMFDVSELMLYGIGYKYRVWIRV